MSDFLLLLFLAFLGLLEEDIILATLFLFLFLIGVTTTLGSFLPGVFGVPVGVVGLPALIDGDGRLMIAPSAPSSPPACSPQVHDLGGGLIGLEGHLGHVLPGHQPIPSTLGSPQEDFPPT